jgi:hypothetical protein
MRVWLALFGIGETAGMAREGDRADPGVIGSPEREACD